MQSCQQLNRWGFDFVSGYKHKPIPPKHDMTASNSFKTIQRDLFVMAGTGRTAEKRRLHFGRASMAQRAYLLSFI
jgi:hypothetical protein